jgi:hypothetical protein
VSLKPKELASVLLGNNCRLPSDGQPDLIELCIEAKLRRAGKGIRLVVGGGWRNDKPGKDGTIAFKNEIPMEIVRIFEKHGFIWGGRCEACLARLPERTSRAFMMREWLEMDPREIQSLLNVSQTNLRALLYLARMQLRLCLDLNWER